MNFLDSRKGSRILFEKFGNRLDQLVSLSSIITSAAVCGTLIMSLIVALGCCVGRRSPVYSRLTVHHSSAGSRYLRWIGAVWTRHRMDFYLLRFYVYRLWINSDDDSVRHRNSSWRKQFFIVLEIWPRQPVITVKGTGFSFSGFNSWQVSEKGHNRLLRQKTEDLTGL